MIRKKLFLLALGLSILAPVWAQAIDSARADMLDAARRELLGLSAKAVPPSSLGEWKDVTDSACFMLFRRTELYRGPMRAMVISSRDITARLYPEGTLVLSTGLFDYIDDALFESAAGSPRRMRDFSGEREARLVPFIALEASRFSLDLPYRAWCRRQENSGGTADIHYSACVEPSTEECLTADSFALTLLRLAEYSPEGYCLWLSSLNPRTEGLPTAERPIDRYRSAYPRVEDRLASISSSRERILKITGEFSDVIAGLKTRTAFHESLSSINSLRESYPDSPYLARLEALTLHALWLSSMSPNETAFTTIFPFASETDYGAAPLATGQAHAPVQAHAPGQAATEVAPSETFRYPQERSNAPGDSKSFDNARSAYRRALGISSDPTLESSFASLLVWSEKREERQEALRIAAEAASSESGSAPFETRANYASILFLTGVDRPRAISMMENLATPEREIVSEEGFLIPQGIPGDGRDLVANLSRMYHLMGNADKADPSRNTVSRREGAGDQEPIAWRSVHVGDSADALIAHWGEPDEIAYNYYTENWHYHDLDAVIRVAETKTGSGRAIKAIRIGPLSPISPGGDVRTGDKRADFEAVFGKPVWYANDEAVYCYRGNALSVLYLSGRIRSVGSGL